MERTFEPAGPLRGALRVPGDKSISHRALIFGAMSEGRVRIRNCAPGQDVASTASVLRALGVEVSTGPPGGAASLSRRPMDRVAEPLRKMGASVELTDGRFPPLTVSGGDLSGIEYELPVASAQVKGAVLLAGLQAAGPTAVVE